MKKQLIALCCAGILLSGCATMRIEAPVGGNVTLAPNYASQTQLVRKRVFFALWGLIPISDNSSAAMLATTNAKNVSVSTYYDPLDVVISLIGGLASIHSQTIEVRGK
jgi:hypothetical protein